MSPNDAPIPAALRVGDIDIHVVSDGGSDYTPSFVYPGLPDEEVRQALGDRMDESGSFRLQFDCVLLSTPTRRIVIDTGYGGDRDDPDRESGWLLDNLAAAGVAEGDVDTVVITHAHPDHIGGVLRGDGLAFPNARYLLPQAEWDWWMSDEALSRLPGFLTGPARTVLPALERSGRLDLVRADAEVAPGIELVAAPGHTPGHVGIAVSSGSEQALLLADAIVDEGQFAHPSWTGVPDGDPDQTVATRIRLLEYAIDVSSQVLAYHIAGMGQVERHGGAYHFTR